MINENQWNSRIAFLLSMIGAAVGLGNIWRYSYVVYSNGGGTFFIPYLLAILIMGIPFLVLEYGIGFRHKDSFSNILKSINPKIIDNIPDTLLISMDFPSRILLCSLLK